jgi:hypothetical protein
MNDADLFIVSGATIKALAKAWDDRDKLDFFSALDECKQQCLPEKSIAILYYGSGGEIMMRKIKNDE